MSALLREIEQIRDREIDMLGEYPQKSGPPDLLRIVFFVPYGHSYSLLSLGTMTLYDMINRDASLAAVAERALLYDAVVQDGSRLRLPDLDAYRTIESPLPVADADVLAISITNAGNLATVFQILDLAGIPRRSADRVIGEHPLILGGGPGFANPEVLGDYVDVVAVGEAEVSVRSLLAALPEAAKSGDRSFLLESIAAVPGLYVPSMYDVEYDPDGGVRDVRPRRPAVPAKVRPQYLPMDRLPASHFVAPISDGETAMMVPTLGCRWDCHFCTLGVPPFRQVPYPLLTDYLDRCEHIGIRTFVISSPTFTQYSKRFDVLRRLKDYSDRSGGQVTTILGSVRADEVSNSYLDAVNDLGHFGHMLTELRLQNEVRGVITIAPEFAAPDLVRIFNKTLTRDRVNRSVEMCGQHDEFNTIMLYFMVGVPSETTADRLAIADYAVDVFDRLGREDGTVIVKFLQYMPKPGTVGQRLAMRDPGLIDAEVKEIEDRLVDLVGRAQFERNFRVLWGESGRMHLESVCGRGDRRIGAVLESLHDKGLGPAEVTPGQLREALSLHGLRQETYLRRMDDELLPWEIVNGVDPAAERELLHELDTRDRGNAR